MSNLNYIPCGKIVVKLSSTNIGTAAFVSVGNVPEICDYVEIVNSNTVDNSPLALAINDVEANAAFAIGKSDKTMVICKKDQSVKLKSLGAALNTGYVTLNFFVKVA